MANRLTDIQKQYKEVYTNMKKEGKKAFAEAVKEVFENYPNVEAFKWSQYTPSWNDGSPCTFHINEESLACKVKEGGPEWTSDHGEEEGWFQYESPKEVEAALDEFGKLLSPEELLETIFGTNVTIICTRSKIETEDYDCGY